MFPAISFRLRTFAALVCISAATSLVIGLVVYYFAENRLIETESKLLIQRSRTANAGAAEFVEGLRNPEDQTLPSPDTYAEELVGSVSAPTGLEVIFLSPDGVPLAAKDDLGNSIDPKIAYRKLDLSKHKVREVAKSSGGRLVPQDGWPMYISVYPLEGADGGTQGVMVYYAPQDELRNTLAYLRYGIIGALAASILFAGAASFLLANQITRPLSETRDAAMRFASGDYSPVSTNRKDELGEVARALNYMADEIRRNLEEIQEQKSRLEAVLEASPETVVVTDIEERVTMANPAAAFMLGVTGAGHTLEECGVPAEVLQCVREALANGVAVREIEYEKKTYWAYAASMDREEGNSRTPGIILVVHDITEYRALERTRTAFVSDVSHELRTPLTTIQSAVDLLESNRDRLDPPQNRALELAEQELARIRGMVEELLTLAQVDALQYALEVGTADLNKVIENSVESLKTKAERFGIEVLFENDHKERRCVCDAEKLYQVFLNLLDNAIKYSDPGSRVDISSGESNSHVMVCIKDTGVGIPAEDIEHLFERFYRVDKVRSRATGGSGLGLAIAKEIVELHDGEILVESEPGKGSTFTVLIPKVPLPRSMSHAV